MFLPRDDQERPCLQGDGLVDGKGNGIADGERPVLWDELNKPPERDKDGSTALYQATKSGCNESISDLTSDGSMPAVCCSPSVKAIETARSLIGAEERSGFVAPARAILERRQEINAQKKYRQERFEKNCRYVMSILGSPEIPRSSERFAKALAEVNGTLFRLAWFFFRDEVSAACRKELALDSVQAWHRNMLAKGFHSYLANRQGRPFTPYAIRSLHNICDSIKRRLPRGHSVELADDFMDRRSDPRKAAELRELLQVCDEALKVLPPHLQVCLRLIYWEGLSGRDVAKRMMTNPRTVATWHFRARQQLAEIFRKRGHGPP
jgi:RNA polymerase sigma factor (sigma-70 family)